MKSSDGWINVSTDDISESSCKEQDIRSTSSNEGDENNSPLTVKIYTTALAYILMFVMSFTFSILGPCLLDIASLFSVESDTASTLFLWLGIGGLVGSLIFGKLYDIIRETLVLIPNVLIGAVVTAAIPWVPSFPWVCVMFGLQGLTMASLTIGSHMLVLRCWGDKNGPFLQALHLMWPIAALITPQVARPFLIEIPQQDNTVNVTNRPNISDVTWLPPPYNESSHSMSTSSVQHYSSGHTMEPWVEPDTKENRIFYIYIINASILLLLTLISFTPFCYKTHISQSSEHDQIPKNEKYSIRKRVFEKCIWIIFFVSAICLGNYEAGLAGMVFTFVVEYLNWSKSDGTLLLTISSACYAAGRLIGILAASFLTPKIILAIDHVVILTSLLCLTFLVHVHPLVMWICCSLCLFGVATVIASYLTWARDFFHVTGLFTSLYLVGHATGLLAGPAIVGHLFKGLHPMWFCYLLIIFVGSMFVLYLVLLLFECLMNNQKQVDNNKVEMKEY